MNPWYNVSWSKQKTKEDSYELHTSYHRRTLLSTGILQKRIQLSKNSGINGQKRKYSIEGAAKELYTHVRYTDILSTHSTEEIYILQREYRLLMLTSPGLVQTATTLE